MESKLKISIFSTCKIILLAMLFIQPIFGQDAKVKEAVCEISPTEGSKVKGTVSFTQTAEGVKVVADLSGLTPGKHGFHIHEFGDCSAPDGSSAGGHFNPDHKDHGAPMDTIRHAGDLGNITADASGNAHMEFTDKMISLSGENSIINKGVIVHQKVDDLKTQPTGDAGARAGCGKIVVKKKM
ncbi:MAG: superoxide dismutase family protein [Saprospiraceae bacterium]|jgi:Cu-Zn family superoxide dismutase|nr:superoxide dismutase family protein [Saprospiraceae bacterium]MBK8632133.1 superoxide dismutase family protein [Saprospiraceae bacterium]